MKLMKEKAEQFVRRNSIMKLVPLFDKVVLKQLVAEETTKSGMATGNDSLKTKDFRLNPKAGLCYSENGNSVALTGEVEVITDAEIKKELWQEWFIAHFPLGPADPNYVLLKFKGQKATIWIDGVFIHE